MPRLAALALCAATMIAQACQADTRDDVTALIRTGDQAAILSALSNPDRAEQRRSFAAFQTARADAGAVSAALLAAHPNDPRAMAARGWHLQALGWAMRGEQTLGATFPEALDRMAAMHGEAFDLAQGAAAADPRLLPASDLILSLARTTGQRRLIPAELDRIMAVWPNRQSLILAIGGMTPVWGGPPGWGPKACARHAASVSDVPGYTSAICELDILFAAPYPRDDRVRAYERLAGVDHPVLDPARREWAMSGLMPDALAIATLQAMLDAGQLGLMGADRLDRLTGQLVPGDIGPAAKQVLDAEVARLRAAVDFNPADGQAIYFYVDALMMQATANGTPAPRNEILARFGDRIALAPYDSDAWARFGDLMSQSIDWNAVTLGEIEAIRGIYESAVFYSNHSLDNLFSLDGYNRGVWDRLDRRNVDAVDMTGQTAFAKADFDVAVICPTVRTIRLIEAACEGETETYACTPAADPGGARPALIARAEKRQACEVERDAPIMALAYAPMPLRLPDRD